MSDRTDSPPTRTKAAPRWRTEGVHPANEPNGQVPRSRLPRWFPVVFIVILATNLIISSYLTKATQRVKFSYTRFLSQLEQGNVVEQIDLVAVWHAGHVRDICALSPRALE
jgi:hypothetical protein